VGDAAKWSLYLNEAIATFSDQIEVLIAQHDWPRWGRDTMAEIGPMLKLPSIESVTPMVSAWLLRHRQP
jgi:hypothetical protein